MKLEVTVTQDDIDKGVRGQPGCCPIARALARTCPRIHASVGDRTADLYADGEWLYETDLPREAKAFVAAFDAEKPVAPFTFTLVVPESD